jgi:outer membrane protein OmpA-like peptidoglycan-associated protein
MRRVLVALIVAVVGLTLINLFQDIGNRHSIEHKLTDRSDRALTDAGITADVSFTGRDGTVKLTSAADKDRAERIVRGLTGVRVAHVEAPAGPVTQTTPKALPRVRIEVDGGRATASGTVPTEAAKTALGGGDQLTVDPAVGDTGLAGLPAVVSALGPDAQNVVVDLSDGRLTLTGTVPSPAVKDTVDAAAQRVTGNVVDQLQVQPPVQSSKEIQAQLSALSQVTFAYKSATLTDQGKQVVAKVAAILRANPSVKVSIEGHTDSRGTAASNRALSQARAQAVRNALVASGIAADRLTATGFGSSRPKVPNTSDANRAVNRRVEFVVR